MSPDFRERPFTFCKQFINRKQTAPSICLLLPFKITGGASQLLLLLQSCLHRCFWRKGTWAPLPPPRAFLSRPSAPCPSQFSHSLWVFTLHWPSTQRVLRAKHPGAFQEKPGDTWTQGKISFVQRSLEPSFSSDFPPSMLAKYIFTILKHKYRGKGRWPNVHMISSILWKHHMSYPCPPAAIRKANIKFRFKALSAIGHSATLIQADLAWELYMWKRHCSPFMREHSNPISTISQKKLA